MRKMKKSNIAWIGNIPENWDIMRIKNVAWLKGRIGWDGLKADEFKETGPFLITGTDFEDGHVNWNTCVHITPERYAEDELLHIQEGDLLITKDGTIGKLAIVQNCPDEVSLNSGVMIIRNSSAFKYHDKYMYYMLMSTVFTEWFESEQKPGSTIRHLYQHQFSEFKFPYPAVEEQSLISAFLDERCDNIDKAIERHKAIIDAANQLRISIISQAVTRGITSEPLVDSGIAWASKIPQSWTKGKLKYLTTIKTAKADNDNLPYIALENVESCTMQYVSSESEYDPSAAVTCAKGDILFGKLRPYLSKVFILPYDACCSNEFMVFSDFQGEPDYLKYLLVSNGFIDTVNGSTYGAKMPRANPNFIKNMFIPVPPVEEQKKIAEFLDEKCEALNQAIIKREAIINKLEEYRKSLIYNAVTGKIDCTEEQ